MWSSSVPGGAPDRARCRPASGARQRVNDVSEAAVAELAPRLGVRAACDALGIAQASYYRRHRTSPAPARPAPVPHRDRAQPRALSAAEAQAILDVLHSDRFADMSPTEVWAILLDEGRYLGSIATFYQAAAPYRRDPRAAPPSHPPGHGQAGADRHRTEPSVIISTT